MKDIRISRLILNLSKEELAIIKKDFIANKQKLFLSIVDTILQLKKIELTREAIYLRIYKKKLTAKNDALFRNHLSNLANIIEDLLIENKLPKKYETDIQFQLQEKLDLYFQLNLEKEYETTLKKTRELVLQNYNYTLYTKELERYIVLFRKTIKSVKDSLEKMQFVESEYKMFYEKQQDLENGKYQYNKAFSVFYHYQAGQLKILTPTNLQPYIQTVENSTTDIGKFWSLYGICYLVYDHIVGYIHYFEDFVAVAKKIYATNYSFKAPLISAMQMIATKYVNIGNFEEANKRFEEAFELIGNEKNTAPHSLYLNYISNLVKLQKYEQALEYVNFVENNLDLNQQDIVQFFLRKIMCYTFLEQADLLQKVILDKEYAALLPSHRIYFRLSLCNAYIMQQQFELAETEIKNLLRSKLMNEIDADFLPCAELTEFLIIQINKNKNVVFSKNQIIMFNEFQDKLNVNQYPYLKNYTPYLWIKNKVERK